MKIRFNDLDYANFKQQSSFFYFSEKTFFATAMHNRKQERVEDSTLMKQFVEVE
jgi:hypothetical protein